ncbi:hypothetical protein [Paraburkholderia diazotrophica]|uniref:Uncharacterized protein n=1 Tax=Paraburkholderia diazotrophica TaxID=667676 RepID=A0A1H7CPT9_9BURK|nr:hypothetical protein [Paraburkholderia diazotrophica]SEJ91486.1 hypothetical protein SAMN05192539_102367 [Paraburkholderia diazotrophica]
MNFKRFQNTIVSSYRITMAAILLLIVAGVMSYLFLMVFYAVNRNWSAPIVLSPTQEKVLAYQPQVSALEAALLKNRVDLTTATERYRVITQQIEDTRALIERFNTAAHSESHALALTEADMRFALGRKRIDSLQTEKAAAEVKPMLASVDSDLAAGLITKDQAMSRRLNIQSAMSAITDSHISEITLREQARAAAAASRTLGGGPASSLTALQSLTNEAQLRMTLAQANVDAETARQSVDQLRATVANAERVLSVAKRSPYYLALTRSVAVVFVQYDNLTNATPGASVFDCYLQVIACRKVGTVEHVYDAEEYARQPLFKTDIKGRFVRVDFSVTSAEQSPVVFIGHKPLLF